MARRLIEEQLGSYDHFLPTLRDPETRHRLKELTERQLVDRLASIKALFQSIIVHPDLIQNPNEWLRLEDKLLLENMDQRKSVARTAAEMRRYFEILPRARFCFDIGHARQ